MSEVYDKFQVASSVELPLSLDQEDRALLDENSELGQLVSVEINPWKAVPLDPGVAEKAARAIAELRLGNHVEAHALASEVLEKQPLYSFNRSTWLEAHGLIGSVTLDEMVAERLKAIDILNRQANGLEGTALREPVDPRHFAFELARHYYNLGDDLHDLALKSETQAEFELSATYFGISLAYTDAEMFPANAMIRLVRQAVVLALAGKQARAERCIQDALSINQQFPAQYAGRSIHFAPALNIIREQKS